MGVMDSVDEFSMTATLTAVLAVHRFILMHPFHARTGTTDTTRSLSLIITGF